jgi:membrane-associated phospholipid phosphatase
MRHHFRSCVAAGCLALALGGAPGLAVAQSAGVQGLTGGTGEDTSGGERSGSLRQLFAETIEDFRRLPSVESATILSLGGLGAAISRDFDAGVTTGLSSSGDLRTVFGAGESLGSAQAQAVAAAATYAVGRLTRHPRATTIGADLVRAQLLTQATTTLVKVAATRTRPDGTGYSFPSGHSSTAFATATVLQRHLGWDVGIPAYAAAAYVAASRIQVKRHFLSDVAFGAAIGIVAGRTVTIGRGDARFAVSPAAAPGGGAVSFTWIGR